MEATVVTDRQRDSRFFTGVDSRLGIGASQSEWFFTENVLTVLCSSNSLWSMLGVRRYQNYRIDIWIRNDVFE